MIKHTHQKGFTLVELIVAVGISIILLLMIVALFSAFMQARIKHQSIADVEAEGVSVMLLMTQAVRNATSVSSPAISMTGSSLSLATSTPATNPTVFSLTSGGIYTTEGSGTSIPLTSSQVIASDMQIQNLSRSNTSGSVKIQFTLTHKTGGRFDSTYSKTFYGSATVRKIIQ